MKFIERLRSALVDDWRDCWRWLSVQAAIIAGAVAGWAASEPEQFARMMEALPPWARPLVGAGVAIIPIYLRIYRQEGRSDGE
ncbi:MAG: hypothetical protein E2598_07425 [Sphingobium sp.]|nr:hypothetical protein [Sphingobium sp.]